MRPTHAEDQARRGVLRRTVRAAGSVWCHACSAAGPDGHAGDRCRHATRSGPRRRRRSDRTQAPESDDRVHHDLSSLSGVASGIPSRAATFLRNSHRLGGLGGSSLEDIPECFCPPLEVGKNSLAVALLVIGGARILALDAAARGRASGAAVIQVPSPSHPNRATACPTGQKRRPKVFARCERP
jgi:hypothetical protein